MKYILLLILGISLSVESFAQAQLSTASKEFLLKYQLVSSTNAKREYLNNDFIERYNLYYKNGNYYIGVIALVDQQTFNKNEFVALGIKIQSQHGKVISLRVPVHQFSLLQFMNGLLYIDVGEMQSPYLDRALITAAVKPVHAGLNGLIKRYRGKGVIIAVIDWGIDYTHPVFYDSSQTQYRISRAWDQNKMSGPHPAGYDYGAEYIGKDELLAAKEDTLYVFGPGSHATHVGGIAGGAGAGSKYTGVAPECELIFISYRRDPAAFADAIAYISNYAKSVGKPYVVNMSFGNHNGPHDGTLPENTVIAEHAGKGKVFVASAGNNGDAPFHLKHTFTQDADTLKTVVNFGAVANMYGQTLSLWGSANTSFGLKFGLANGANQLVFTTPVYQTSNEPTQIDTFVVTAGDTLIVSIQSVAKSVLNDKPSMRIDVKRTGLNKLVLFAFSEQTELHIWNVIRLNNRITNWGVALTNNFPGALAGNTEYGLGEPGGVDPNTITVASNLVDVTNSRDSILSTGNLSAFSSRGPTVDGRIKPDISGPGQNITSSVNSFDPAYFSSQNTVLFQGKAFPFASLSGTSMSSPAVAGVVALLLEVNPNLSANEIKHILKVTARLDDKTGNIDSNGTTSWGWGKLNALAAVKLAEVYSSAKPIFANRNALRVYPNPANTHVKLSMGGKVTVFDVSGRLMLTMTDYTAEQSIDIQGFEHGVYLLMLEHETAIFIQKFVVR